MADAVKTRGSRRRTTRRKIVEAATLLFLTDGYSATTLEQIATSAGVAVQTVYFHFGNKRTVLKEAVDVAAVGDDEPVPMLDRSWLQQAQNEQDPRQVIAAWTAYGRGIMTRIGPMMRVVRDAAAVEPEMAQQWSANEAETASAFRVLAEQLDARNALRVSISEAVDILCALSGLETYLLLAARGWTPTHWEGFVADALTHALLGDAEGCVQGGPGPRPL